MQNFRLQQGVIMTGFEIREFVGEGIDCRSVCQKRADNALTGSALEDGGRRERFYSR